MDAAVALVQAYLHVNGYFTVTEYPVLEGLKNVRTVTDLDILAYRLAGAATPVADGLHGDVSSAGALARHRGRGVADLPGGLGSSQDTPSAAWGSGPDPALHAPIDGPDMIVGEVKEGRARLNPALRDPRVLAAALARFGCCDVTDAAALTRRLLATGQVRTPAGHMVRIVAFGDTPDHRFEAPGRSAGGVEAPGVVTSPVGVPGASATVSMRHVVDVLQEHLAQQWQQARHAQFHDPALGVLAMLQKWAEHPAAGRNAVRRPDRAHDRTQYRTHDRTHDRGPG